jgi:hypothetical protein
LLVDKFKSKEWIPSNKKISFDENENNNPTNFKEKFIQEIQQLSLIKYDGLISKIEKFDKNSETNGHIEFIRVEKNCRTVNYRIQLQIKLEIRRLPGHFIPVLSTKTSMFVNFYA